MIWLVEAIIRHQLEKWDKNAYR